MNKVEKALATVQEKVRNRLGFETLETRNRDSLDFHDVSVSAIRDIIKMAFEAGQKVTVKKTSSKKTFHLLYVHGSVDPSVIGKPYKNYESLLKAARDFFKSDDYTEGEDGLFYVVKDGNDVRVSPFDSSDLEGEN